MVYGQVPDGETLVLCISCTAAAAAFVVNLREAGGKLAASGTGGGYNNNITVHRNEGICAVAVLGDNIINILGVAGYGLVEPDFDVASLEHVRKVQGTLFSGETGYDNLVRLDVPGGKVIYHLENVRVIGNSEVAAHLAVLNVCGIDADYYIQAVFQGLEDTHLYVGVKAGKNSCCVIVEKQLSAAFQIESAVDHLLALCNEFCLFSQIFIIVKPYHSTLLSGLSKQP